MQQLNINNILDRIKKIYNLNTDTQLNELMKLKKHTIATWRFRNTIDFITLYNFCNENNLNINYILSGEGEPFLESIDKLKLRIKELEEELKKTNSIQKKDNTEIAILENEISILRNKLAFAEELILKLAKNIP
jgi:hypothetical protein